MVSNVGGMRHIGTVAGLTDQVCGEVRNLDEQSMNDVLNYIAKIKRDRPTRTQAEDIGSVKALGNHVGRWSFNEGERAGLVQAVYQLREKVG
jgi:hypothetical protein